MLLFDQILKFLLFAPNRILFQSCVLGIILFVRIVLGAPRLDASRILLTYNKHGLPSNYSLQIEDDHLNDCYEWKSAKEYLVTVDPLYEGSGERKDCSRAAIVSVISSAAERITTRLTAKGRSGIELVCDVITDFPDKLELTYLTDELSVNAPPEVITVIAKDRFGHQFTSINGMKIDWELKQDLDESVQSSDSIVARLRPYSSFGGHPDGWMVRGLLGHSVLVETLNAGSCKIKASVMLTDNLEISTKEAKLRVLPNLRVIPSSTIRLLRYGTVHLAIENARGEEYKKDVKMSVEKPELVNLEDSSLSGLEYGQTYVTVKSDDNKFASIDVNLEVVKAAKIEIRISEGDYTILEELKSYFVSVDLFDHHDKLIFPSENLRISVSFPTHFYVNHSTSNGTWHIIQTLTPGKGVIRAELKGVVLSDGSLHKEKLSAAKTVTVAQRIQVFPPFTILPSDSLNSSFHEIRLMATGGTGQYLWASNNEAAAVIHFEEDKSHVGHLEIRKEADFVVTVTDALNFNFFASAKVSLQEVIDLETYPTVVEAEVGNILILPVAFLAYEDKEKKIVRKFDDCSKISPKVEIIENYVLSYDEEREPHIPAFGKGCRSLKFRCEFPGHSRINVEFQARNKTLKTTTVLSCFRNLKPVHPVRVAVLSLGSSIDVGFEGGPRKWPLYKKGHYTILEASEPELLNIELVRDPIRYNKDLTVFRVVCKGLGENTLTFRIGNEPSATNPHPAKAESSIKVVCCHPSSVHLKLFRKQKKKNLHEKNIVKVPFYGEKLFAVDVWLKDSMGRKVYNISTVNLKWSLSDLTLASIQGSPGGFETYENAVAGYRKITRNFKEFKMTGGTGELQVKAEVLGYRKDALSKVGITKSGNLKEISGSIDLNLVSLRDLNAGFYSNDDNEQQEKEGTCDGDSCTS